LVILTTSLFKKLFSGGSNDNRAWQPYSLGPGRSGAKDDFNEANMKIAFSSEFRFKILGELKGTLLMQVISGMFTTT
jgi:hypothetical protein